MPPILIAGLALLTLVTYGIGSGTNQAAAVATAVFFPSAIALYFSPAITAARRQRPNVGPITIVNLFLGWTLVGWVGALAWVYSTPKVEQSPLAAAPTTAESASKKCPYCAEEIKAEAKICRFCNRDVPAMAQ